MTAVDEETKYFVGFNTKKDSSETITQEYTSIRAFVFADFISPDSPTVTIYAQRGDKRRGIDFKRLEHLKGYEHLDFQMEAIFDLEFNKLLKS